MNIVLVFTAVCMGFVASQNCDQTRFTACTYNFAQMLGVNTTGISFWRDPTLLMNAAQALFISTPNDMAGPVRLCNAFQLFYGCLGPQYIDGCIGPVPLIRLGLTPDQAFTDEGIFRQNIFQCGAGLFVAEGGFVGCFQSTIRNFNATLTQMYQTYRTNINHDPAGACIYIRELSQGYSSVFMNGPCASVPRTSLAGWWACEGQKEFAIAQFPTCVHEVTCDASVSKSFDDENVKTMNGQVMFKLSKKWTQQANGQWQLIDGEWITG